MTSAAKRCLCFILCFSGWAHAQSLIDSLERVENGVPPPDEAQELKRSQDRLQRLFIRIIFTLETEAARETQLAPNCRRFLSTSKQVAQSLDEDIRAYPAGDFQTNHLQIALFAFSELTSFLNNHCDGGYSLLDPNMKAPCPFEHREIISSLFNQASSELARFFQLAFGAPGLKQMFAAQKELLKAAIEDESRDQKKLWLLAGAGTLASIAIWELAPLAATRAMSAIRVSALAAEGAVLSYAGSLATAHAEPLKLRLGSWEEHMRTLELFLNSPLRSPELQMALLSRTQEMMVRDASTWIERQADQLQTDPRARQFLGRSDLLQATSGISFEEQMLAASRYIENEFKFRLICNSSWPFSMSRPSCLLGMHTIAEALFSGQLKPPPEILEVRITDTKNWQKMDPEENLPSMTVPYSLSASELSQFVNAQLNSKGYRRRLQQRERLDDLRVELQAMLGKPVDLNENLHDAQALVALIKLKLLAGTQPEIFKSPAESLRVSNRFAFPYERNLKLIEDIDWSANIERMKNYLIDAGRMTRDFAGDPRWPESFLIERQSYRRAESDFAKKFKIDSIECSAVKLSIKDCALALKRLDFIFSQNRLSELQIGVLVLADRSELHHNVEYSFDPTFKKMVFILRHDIRLREMSRWLKARGWAQ